MKNLEDLYFGACDIEEETLSEITKIKALKKLYFGHCMFRCSEEDFNRFTNEISAKGIENESEYNEFLN